jgi:hypothetical protein
LDLAVDESNRIFACIFGDIFVLELFETKLKQLCESNRKDKQQVFWGLFSYVMVSTLMRYHTHKYTNDNCIE